MLGMVGEADDSQVIDPPQPFMGWGVNKVLGNIRSHSERKMGLKRFQTVYFTMG